ncbi:YrhK family protein [Teredinibacter turnerae]|uniref:YrhK family protein n=1 Tax=Teredinibacter turnerae TaxID=2426 RepID=UPI000368B9C2|nr:YrhK family protein [Teredinibacter turnerae]
MTDNAVDNPLTLKLGHKELVIRRRYEVISIVNDFIVAVLFLVGSILFLFPERETAAIWLFICGSFQFLLRPTIRLIGHLHISNIPPSKWEN